MKLKMILILMCSAFLSPIIGQEVLSVYKSEDAFTKAIGQFIQADDLKDLDAKYTTARVIRACGQSGYCCRTYSQLLWKSPGEIAAGFPIDTIYVSNQSKSVYFLGGNFYNANADGQFVEGVITVKAGDCTYSFRSDSKNDFIGFVFDQPVSEVKLSGGSMNLKDDIVLTISHVYLGDHEKMISSIE